MTLQKFIKEHRPITVQCESFEQATALRQHLLLAKPFYLTNCPNPVSLGIGYRVWIETDSNYNKLYVDGWLAGYEEGYHRGFYQKTY